MFYFLLPWDLAAAGFIFVPLLKGMRAPDCNSYDEDRIRWHVSVVYTVQCWVVFFWPGRSLTRAVPTSASLILRSRKVIRCHEMVSNCAATRVGSMLTICFSQSDVVGHRHEFIWAWKRTKDAVLFYSNNASNYCVIKPSLLFSTQSYHLPMGNGVQNKYWAIYTVLKCSKQYWSHLTVFTWKVRYTISLNSFSLTSFPSITTATTVMLFSVYPPHLPHTLHTTWSSALPLSNWIHCGMLISYYFLSLGKFPEPSTVDIPTSCGVEHSNNCERDTVRRIRSLRCRYDMLIIPRKKKTRLSLGLLFEGRANFRCIDFVPFSLLESSANSWLLTVSSC